MGQYILAIPHKNRVIVRLGTKRDAHYAIPESKMNDVAYRSMNDEKYGHTNDLYRYLIMSDNIVAQMDKK